MSVRMRACISYAHTQFCRASSGAPFAAILAFGEAAIEWYGRHALVYVPLSCA